MIENYGNTAKAVLALLALIPGLAALFDLISIPPTSKETLKIAVITTSLVSALSVLILTEKIVKARESRLLALIAVLFLLGIGSLFTWHYYYDKLQYKYEYNGEAITVVLPVISGPMQTKYETQLGQALQSSNIKNDLRAEINSRNRQTPIFWGIMLALAQFGLTASILLGVVKITKRD